MGKANNRAAKLLAIILTFVLIFTQNIYAFAADTKVKTAQSNTNDKSYQYIQKNGVTQYYTPGEDKPASTGKPVAASGTSILGSKVQKNTIELKTNNPRKSTLKNAPAVNTTKVQQNSTISTTANAKKAAAGNNKNSVLNKKAQSRPKYVPGELLVKFKNDVTESAKSSTYSKHSMQVAKKLQSVKADVVKLPAKMSVESAVQTLKADKNVELVQPNYLYYPADFNPAINDTLSNKLWGLENTGQAIIDLYTEEYVNGTPDIDIDASDAWKITTGDPSTIVGIIDTGIDINHADLLGRIWTNPVEIPNNGIDEDHNGYIDDVNGWDFFNNDNTVFDPEDGDEHGTHVAGTIAAAMNNSIGVAGVAPNVKVMPLKFLGPEGGSTRDSILAMEYAQKQGVKILNNSWGGGMYDDLLKFAIESSGMLYVAAAGNYTMNMDNEPYYPAAYDCPNILSVAAVDNNGTLAGFSNYGANTVDVAAPGVSIMSTYPKKPTLGAAIQSDNGVYKTLYQGFGLESVSTPAERAALMTKALQFFGITSTSKILLVQDDDSDLVTTDPYYINCLSDYNTALTSALTTLGYPTSNITTLTVNSADNGPNYATLSQNKLVIWFTGNSWGVNTNVQCLTGADQDNLKYYLQNGGKLYLSGKDAGWNIAQTEFYNKYLHAKFLFEAEDAPLEMPAVIGKAGAAFENQRYTLIPTEYFDFLKPYDSVGKTSLLYEGDPEGTNRYAYMNGTSMAAPHVSGIAALLYSKGTNDPMQIKNRIMGSCTYLPNLEGLIKAGGLVNANAALQGNPDDDIPGVGLKPENIGTLDQNNDIDDVYNVFLHPGQKITLALTGDNNTDFDLHVYSSNAQTVTKAFGLLASSENPNTSSEEILFTAEEPGLYFIDVYGYAGAGGYTLTSQIMDRVYEDNDPELIYEGTWKNLSDATNYSAGTAKELAGPGSINLSFDGSKIKWTAFKNSKQGKAVVYIDDVYAGEVNLYSPTPLYNQTVFERSLTNGLHQMEIKWAGMWDRKARKTSTNINIDMLTVSSEKVKPAAPTNLTATGFMERIRLEFDYNTTPGTNFFVIYRCEDGINFNKVDMLYADTSTHYKFYDDSLGDKVYTYKVSAVSNDNVESDPSNAASARPLFANSIYKIDDTSSFVTYSGGTWTTENIPDFYKGSRHITSTIGSKITIPFKGYDGSLKFGYLSGESGSIRITLPTGLPKDILVDEYSSGFGFGYTQQTTGTVQIELLDGTLAFDFARIMDIDAAVPSAPSGLTGALTAAKDGVRLSWPANPEIDIKGYNIYKSTTAGAAGTKITAEPRDVLEVVDNDILAGTNYYYRITAVDYAGLESGKSNEVEIKQAAPPPVPGAGKYEDNDSRINFIGNWNTFNSPNYSGGSLKMSGTAGDYLEFTFTGTEFKWIGIKGTNRGIANVIIDGGTPIPVDCYNISTEYQAIIFQNSGLANTTHNVKIIVTGSKNAKSSSPNVTFDAFEVINSLNPVITRIEDSESAKINFIGNWNTFNSPNYSGGSLKMSGTAGDYLEFTFTGTEFKWIGIKGTNRGIANVIIDGGTPIPVDCYNISTEYQAIIFQNSGLANTTHNVKIIVTGSKNAKSSSPNVTFDAFEITELK